MFAFEHLRCCPKAETTLSGSYPLTRRIATVLIWNSVPQSPISRSHRHQTFFRLFHFIFPIRFIPLLNPFSLRLFLQPRQVHLRFLLISALSFPRLIYLIHGHFIVVDPRIPLNMVLVESGRNRGLPGFHVKVDGNGCHGQWEPPFSLPGNQSCRDHQYPTSNWVEWPKRSDVSDF